MAAESKRKVLKREVSEEVKKQERKTEVLANRTRRGRATE